MGHREVDDNFFYSKWLGEPPVFLYMKSLPTPPPPPPPPPKKYDFTKTTDVYYIDDIWSLYLLYLNGSGPKLKKNKIDFVLVVTNMFSKISVALFQ